MGWTAVESEGQIFETGKDAQMIGTCRAFPRRGDFLVWGEKGGKEERYITRTAWKEGSGRPDTPRKKDSEKGRRKNDEPVGRVLGGGATSPLGNASAWE